MSRFGFGAGETELDGKPSHRGTHPTPAVESPLPTRIGKGSFPDDRYAFLGDYPLDHFLTIETTRRMAEIDVLMSTDYPNYREPR